MPRRKNRVPGVRWRGGVAYYEREHQRIQGGRIYRSLGTRDPQLAETYAASLTTIGDRGDWGTLERWRAGDVHVTDIARAVREGDYARLNRLTVDGTRLGDACERFLRRTEATRKPNTAKVYTVALDALRAALGNDFPMAQLTTERAEAFLHEPKESTGNQPWSARSQGNARTIYKALWSMVIEQEAEAAEQAAAAPTVTRNPWVRARVPEARKTRNVWLTGEQWRKLLRAVRGTPQAAFLACACLAGLRQQEIVQLRTGVDVDLHEGFLRIQDRKGRHAWTVKHRNSQRDVEIVPELRALLEEHIASGFAGERYFFISYKRDRPISHQTAKEWTQRSFKAARIRYGRRADSLTLHSLRHTFGTWMARRGVPFTVIAELMGNTPAVVIATYSHHAPADRKRAMEIIGEEAKG